MGSKQPRAGVQRSSETPEAIPETLTRQERVIFGLLATGASNAEIVAQLHISPNTVKTHLQHLYEKIGQHRRVRASILARESQVTMKNHPSG